jgi:protoporphyrinogen oxidase
MKTIILGAGFAGLSAGHKLAKDYLILEKEGVPGGLCRTAIINGFTFDYTGHFLHLRRPEIKKFVLKNTLVKFREINRKAFIFSHGVYTGYPYQVNNFGLPADIAAENIVGFLRAKAKNKVLHDNYKNWILSSLGAGIAKNFMFPYNLKIYRHPLEKLTVSWMGRFVPAPETDDVMKGMLPKGEADMGYNAYFLYPEKGGIESVAQGLYMGIKKNVRLDCAVKKIDLKSKTVYFGKNEKENYENLISTMPLKELTKLTGDKQLLSLGKKLKATSVYCLNIGFKSKKNIGRHWVYVPEEKYPFYRIGFPSEVMNSSAPKGFSSVFTEVSYTGTVPKNIDAKIVKGLIDMGIIESKKDIVLKYPMILKDAYVLYDMERDETVKQIRQKLESVGIFTAGRWGSWEYSSMEDAILEGFEAAQKIKV